MIVEYHRYRQGASKRYKNTIIRSREPVEDSRVPQV